MNQAWEEAWDAAAFSNEVLMLTVTPNPCLAHSQQENGTVHLYADAVEPSRRI
jgi:hypothetical protein